MMAYLLVVRHIIGLSLVEPHQILLSSYHLLQEAYLEWSEWDGEEKSHLLIGQALYEGNNCCRYWPKYL